MASSGCALFVFVALECSQQSLACTRILACNRILVPGPLRQCGGEEEAVWRRGGVLASLTAVSVSH
jgi:hypothetical protein